MIVPVAASITHTYIWWSAMIPFSYSRWETMERVAAMFIFLGGEVVWRGR